MYKIKILATRDADEWTKLLEETEHPDIYFSPEYAQIYEYNYSKEIDESFCGPSLLFFFGNQSEFVIYPIIKRRINDLAFIGGAKMPETFDIISHYGYSGPLVKCSDKTIEKQLIKGFLDAFNNFCLENNIITEFIRFHPLLNNYKPLEDLLLVSKRNNTVYIDLTKDEQTLLRDMDKKTRNLIRKAEKSSIKINRSTNKDALAKFTELYLQTMERNKANKKYLFPLKFYENTFNLLKDNVSLFVAEYKNKIIAASLFMHKYEFIHYHFSGSDKDFLHLAPNNLLLWKVMLWAKKQGYKKFHLGGGLSLDPKDSLYRFKSGFSKNRSIFCTANIIHNKETYEKLCNLKNVFKIKKGEGIIKSDFFPGYRG